MASLITYWQAKNKSIQNETEENLASQKGSHYQRRSQDHLQTFKGLWRLTIVAKLSNLDARGYLASPLT